MTPDAHGEPGNEGAPGRPGPYGVCHVTDQSTLVGSARPGGMVRPPSRCPNPDCPDSLGGTFERSQYEKVDDGVWQCRECGEVQELG